MNLTGENNIEFFNYLQRRGDIDVHQFNISCDSMQWGVIVDYADSLDIFIYVLAWETEGGDYYFNWEIIGFCGNHSENIRYESRHEARQKAIEKFNEIMNKKL